MPKPEYAFLEGRIVPIEEAKIDIRTNALQYGTAIFEGIRGYWNKQRQKIYVFKMKDHYLRMLENCRILMIDPGYSLDELMSITLELLRKEDYREDVYIRPFAYVSSTSIGPKLIGYEHDFFLYTVPMGDYLDTSRAIKVCVSSWYRLSDNALPPRGKIAGSYVNSALQKTEALLNGFDEAIVLTSDGHVSEGSAMNLFMVKRGVLFTTPTTDEILEGITRRTVIQMAREDLSLEVVEREIDRTELYTADELFFTGTGAQISPIGEVDRRKIGQGEIGPITKQLSDPYFKVVRGEMEKYREWLTEV